ncbi:Small integral membrane protein 13 [Exaiptasia diaphana]|nr:Small integral membrane protein 13 [Exaiptasia diaphana]
MQEILLPTALSVLLAIAAVILVVLLGWFVVWKMFLVRFSFIRELVYGSNGNNNKKSKRKSYNEPETPLRRSSRIRQKLQSQES